VCAFVPHKAELALECLHVGRCLLFRQQVQSFDLQLPVRSSLTKLECGVEPKRNGRINLPFEINHANLHWPFRFTGTTNRPWLEATNLVDFKFLASTRQCIVRLDAYDLVVSDLVFETCRESGLDFCQGAKWHTTGRSKEMPCARDTTDELIL
jgi:hypothetical protein